MKVSQQQLEDFANFVIQHPALAEIQQRFWLRRLADIKASTTDEQLRDIRSLMDNHDAFYKELKIILDNARNIGDNDE